MIEGIRLVWIVAAYPWSSDRQNEDQPERAEPDDRRGTGPPHPSPPAGATGRRLTTGKDGGMNRYRGGCGRLTSPAVRRHAELLATEPDTRIDQGVGDVDQRD